MKTEKWKLENREFYGKRGKKQCKVYWKRKLRQNKKKMYSHRN